MHAAGPSDQCMMRTGGCCDLTCQDNTGGVAATGEATVECPDINLDGTISVADILALLSAFGSADSASDVNDDGVVNVSDILSTLSAFGTSCTVAAAAAAGTDYPIGTETNQFAS